MLPLGSRKLELGLLSSPCMEVGVLPRKERRPTAHLQSGRLQLQPRRLGEWALQGCSGWRAWVARCQLVPRWDGKGPDPQGHPRPCGRTVAPPCRNVNLCG